MLSNDEAMKKLQVACDNAHYEVYRINTAYKYAVEVLKDYMSQRKGEHRMAVANTLTIPARTLMLMRKRGLEPFREGKTIVGPFQRDSEVFEGSAGIIYDLDPKGLAWNGVEVSICDYTQHLKDLKKARKDAHRKETKALLELKAYQDAAKDLESKYKVDKLIALREKREETLKLLKAIEDDISVLDGTFYGEHFNDDDD